MPAASHVSAAAKAVDAWYQDPFGGHGSYRTLDTAELLKEAPAVSPDVHVTLLAHGRAYCLDDEEGSHSAYYVGGDIRAIRNLNGAAAADRRPRPLDDHQRGGRLCERLVAPVPRTRVSIGFRPSIPISMFRAPSKRLAREESGFTMIELLIVRSIFGILASLATPSYISLKQNANKGAAAANVAAIIPDVEWYSYDNTPGGNTSRDPDYNGTDAAFTGTNADSGYTDLSSTDFMSLLQSKYDNSVDPSTYTWDPAAWSPAAGLDHVDRLLRLHDLGHLVRRQARPQRRDHDGQDHAPRLQRRLLRGTAACRGP